MLKLAQDNSLIVQCYFELRKDFDIQSLKHKCAPNDLSIQDITENGFIMTAESDRNADYMHKAAIKCIKVEKNAL